MSFTKTKTRVLALPLLHSHVLSSMKLRNGAHPVPDKRRDNNLSRVLLNVNMIPV
jgi:hypothetical protein